MKYSTGAEKSPIDLRTYSYKPDTAGKYGGKRYKKSSMINQHRVGICTATAICMNAQEATGKQYSPDFNYLLQKKYRDGNWNEGSSAFSSISTAYKYGLLPTKYFDKFITEDDRKLTYNKYIKKLKAISDEDIQELLTKTDKVIDTYAKVPVDRDYLANAISNSEAGLIVRFVIGNEWYREPIEPLRSPKSPISGHLLNEVEYKGDVFSVSNSWGVEWADKGHAIHNLEVYKPTEAWAVFYTDVPEDINKKVTLNQIIKLLKWLKLKNYVK